jgi:hypothetical protein
MLKARNMGTTPPSRAFTDKHNLRRQHAAALEPSSLQHLAAAGTAHSFAEAVFTTALSFLGLIRSFHFFHLPIAIPVATRTLIYTTSKEHYMHYSKQRQCLTALF